MFWKSTYNEFIKIAAKPRSYIGIGAITVIVIIVFYAMYTDGMDIVSMVTRPFEQSLSFEGNIVNGNLIAYQIFFMLIIHVPLLVALVTGDLVSGEGAMGTIGGTIFNAEIITPTGDGEVRFLLARDEMPDSDTSLTYGPTPKRYFFEPNGDLYRN